ncbi:MAG TPA: ribosome biogenesis GTPase Der [Actinomycetota bacterium]|nr:ribosome biogenesis GTPase Der [Actinomycetota bacterium]
MTGESGRPLLIAVDGPAGAGKSTLARRLAEHLRVPYLNTGLMYRAVAARALDARITPNHGARLAELATSISFSMDRDGELRIDGRPPDARLASRDVEAVVSQVAKHPEVRSILRAEQRRLASGGGVVEGRDIGSVVAPEADFKVFLSATPETRASRRQRERGGDRAAGAAIASRDEVDSKTNPFVPAPDAVVLDSSAMDADQVFEEVVRLLHVRSLMEDRPDGHARRVPRVAIVGRPNVGKSTLLNRLLGRRDAISHESAGVTRDRLERLVMWGGRTFALIDTGGFVHRPSGIEAAVARQAGRAAKEADLILLVVDATTGVLEADELIAGDLRRTARPVLVVVNKVDAEAQEPLAAEFHSLGLGEPFAVSAQHGRGAGDLLDRILELIPGGSQPELEDDIPRFALVGRPNVGKSSLFNRVLHDERAVVHEEAGTTRDAIDSVVEVDGRTLRFVDTAGLRRLPKVKDVEYYGLLRSLRAIDEAHVSLLVIDASQGLTGEDKRIAARISEAGRGMVAALNKWDLVPSEDRAKRFIDLTQDLKLFPGTPVVRTSALSGLGVRRLIPALLGVRSAWTKRVPTSEVNRALEAAVASYPPPRGTGRALYGTQVSTGPPTFVVFGLSFPGTSYARYLENTLRREFAFEGVPVRLSFRARHPDKGAKGRGRGASGRRRAR